MRSRSVVRGGGARADGAVGTCARAFVVFALVVGVYVWASAVMANRPGDLAVKRIAPRAMAHAAPPAKKRLSPASQEWLDDNSSLYEAALSWARRIPDDQLERDLAALEGRDEIMNFGPVRVSRRLVETVVRAARKVDIEPALLMAIADKESSFSPTVAARTSSALGLFQFIESTWLGVVRDFGPRHGLAQEAAAVEGAPDKPAIADPRLRDRVLALRNDPWLSALLAAEMLKRDTTEIARSIGRDLTAGETYLTHFLGPRNANLFMDKLAEKPALPAAQLLRKPAQANRSIFFARGKAKPLSDVHAKFEEMIGARVERYAGADRVKGVTAYAQ